MQKGGLNAPKQEEDGSRAQDKSGLNAPRKHKDGPKAQDKRKNRPKA